MPGFLTHRVITTFAILLASVALYVILWTSDPPAAKHRSGSSASAPADDPSLRGPSLNPSRLDATPAPPAVSDPSRVEVGDVPRPVTLRILDTVSRDPVGGLRLAVYHYFEEESEQGTRTPWGGWDQRSDRRP